MPAASKQRPEVTRSISARNHFWCTRNALLVELDSRLDSQVDVANRLDWRLEVISPVRGREAVVLKMLVDGRVITPGETGLFQVCAGQQRVPPMVEFICEHCLSRLQAAKPGSNLPTRARYCQMRPSRRLALDLSKCQRAFELKRPSKEYLTSS